MAEAAGAAAEAAASADPPRRAPTPDPRAPPRPRPSDHVTGVAVGLARGLHPVKATFVSSSVGDLRRREPPLLSSRLAVGERAHARRELPDPYVVGRVRGHLVVD